MRPEIIAPIVVFLGFLVWLCWSNPKPPKALTTEVLEVKGYSKKEVLMILFQFYLLTQMLRLSPNTYMLQKQNKLLFHFPA